MVHFLQIFHPRLLCGRRTCRRAPGPGPRRHRVPGWLMQSSAANAIPRALQHSLPFTAYHTISADLQNLKLPCGEEGLGTVGDGGDEEGGGAEKKQEGKARLLRETFGRFLSSEGAGKKKMAGEFKTAVGGKPGSSGRRIAPPGRGGLLNYTPDVLTLSAVIAKGGLQPLNPSRSAERRDEPATACFRTKTTTASFSQSA